MLWPLLAVTVPPTSGPELAVPDTPLPATMLLLSAMAARLAIPPPWLPPRPAAALPLTVLSVSVRAA